jgi:hypothetical protein
MRSLANTIKSLIISALLSTALLCAPLAHADESLMLRINGFNCTICIGGLAAKLAKLEGVKDVQLWMADGMLAIVGEHVNIHQIQHVVASSVYTFQGLWACPTATADVSRCRKVG